MASVFRRSRSQESATKTVLSVKKNERPHTGWVAGHDPEPFPSILEARNQAISFISQTLGIRFNYPAPMNISQDGRVKADLQVSDILSDTDCRKFEEVDIKPIYCKDGKLIGHNIILRTPSHNGGKKMCIDIRLDNNPSGPDEVKHRVVQSWDVRVSSSGRHMRKASASQHFVVCGADSVR